MCHIRFGLTGIHFDELDIYPPTAAKGVYQPWVSTTPLLIRDVGEEDRIVKATHGAHRLVRRPSVPLIPVPPSKCVPKTVPILSHRSIQGASSPPQRVEAGNNGSVDNIIKHPANTEGSSRLVKKGELEPPVIKIHRQQVTKKKVRFSDEPLTIESTASKGKGLRPTQVRFLKMPEEIPPFKECASNSVSDTSDDSFTDMSLPVSTGYSIRGAHQLDGAGFFQKHDSQQTCTEGSDSDESALDRNSETMFHRNDAAQDDNGSPVSQIGCAGSSTSSEDESNIDMSKIGNASNIFSEQSATSPLQQNSKSFASLHTTHGVPDPIILVRPKAEDATARRQRSAREGQKQLRRAECSKDSPPRAA